MLTQGQFGTGSKPSGGLLFGSGTSAAPAFAAQPVNNQASKGFASGSLGSFGSSNIQQEAKQEKIVGGFGSTGTDAKPLGFGSAPNSQLMGFGGAPNNQPMSFGGGNVAAQLNAPAFGLA